MPKAKSTVASYKRGAKPVGWTKFSDEWLADAEFRDWLEKQNDYKFRCRFCGSSCSVKDDGIRSLRKHAETNKHKEYVRARGVMSKSSDIATPSNKWRVKMSHLEKYIPSYWRSERCCMKGENTLIKITLKIL